MNNSKTATQKHMTLDDRISIEKGLDQHLSLRSIALQLGKDPTTISKEIKKHRSFQEHNRFNEPANKCALAKDCKKKNICGTYAPVCKRMCRSCNHCNSHCEDFIPRSYHCSLLDKAPLSAMVAVKRIPAASIKPTTAHPLHTGNIKPSLWNQEQVLTFRLLTLLLWMNW
ncbi:MAG: helix-turn-helix domain-containing protein [Roseburia inulinivorans]